MPDPVKELYMVPLREFIAARDRLVTNLAAAKERDRAREVRGLRRPTVAAWVVNQLAHRNGAALRRLIDAGDALRRAQRYVIRGGSADDLRAAAKRRQEALRELRSLAGPILREAGSVAHLDDVLATLEAASIDSAAAKAVSAGRLSKELPRPSGFGEAAPLTLVPTRRAIQQTRPAREPTKDRAADVTKARRHTRELAVEAKRLEREAVRSQQGGTRTSRRAATLERAQREQERRVHSLRDHLRESECRLRDVEAKLDRARTEASRASERARQLRRRAEMARARAETED